MYNVRQMKIGRNTNDGKDKQQKMCKSTKCGWLVMATLLVYTLNVKSDHYQELLKTSHHNWSLFSSLAEVSKKSKNILTFFNDNISLTEIEWFCSEMMFQFCPQYFSSSLVGHSTPLFIWTKSAIHRNRILENLSVNLLT